LKINPEYLFSFVGVVVDDVKCNKRIMQNSHHNNAHSNSLPRDAFPSMDSPDRDKDVAQDYACLDNFK
jgi:hypothetical protein